MEALLNNRLECNDVTPFARMTRSWADAVLGEGLEPGSLDERRVGCAILQSVASEIPHASAAFETLSRRRETTSPKIVGETEYDIDPGAMAELRRAKDGSNVA